MIEATLIRDTRAKTHTLGRLVIRGKIFDTIEPPWKDNQRNISCIPQGRYYCKFMARSASGKYKNCYHITGVDGRTGILIHNGNTVKHTLGCVILGTKRGWLIGIRAVLSSKLAMSKLARLTNKQDFMLTIYGA